MTYDDKILLQYRPKNWLTTPDRIVAFGGHVEEGETPDEAVIREIKEETGGIINKEYLIVLGLIEENKTTYCYLYFWKDREKTITGCYETEAIVFNTLKEGINNPKTMEHTKLALNLLFQRN